MYLADLLSRAVRDPSREETMQGQKVEMHVKTTVAADDMCEDGMLEELRKERVIKDNNYLQALEEVRRGWVKKRKSYKGYLKKNSLRERM